MLGSQNKSYKIVNFKISTKSIFDLSKKKFDFSNNESIDTSSPSSYLIYEENENHATLKTKTLHQALCHKGNKIKVLYLQSALDIVYLHKALVHKNCEVTTLCAHTDFDLEQSKIFANILKKNSTITTLKIYQSSSYWESYIIHIILPSLNENKSLTNLDIGRGDLSAIGACYAFFKNIKIAYRNTPLHIYYNVDDICFLSFPNTDTGIEQLHKNNIFLHIPFFDCQIYLIKLSVSFIKSDDFRPTSLRLAAYPPSSYDHNLELFTKILQKNTSIVEFELYDVNMSSRGVNFLLEIITHNNTIKILKLSRCLIQKEDVEKLLIAIGESKGLQHILLHSDKNIKMDQDILADILRNNKNLLSCKIIGYVDSLSASLKNVLQNNNMLFLDVATEGESMLEFACCEDLTQAALSSKINTKSFYQLRHDEMHYLTYGYISILSSKIRAAINYNEQLLLYKKFVNMLPSGVQNFLLDLEQYLLELIPDHLNLLRVPALFLENAVQFSDASKLPATRAAFFKDSNPIASIISILQKENIKILEMLPGIISTLAGDEIVKSCTTYRYIVQALLQQSPEQQKSLDPDYVIFFPTKQFWEQKALRLFEKTSDIIASILPHQANEYAEVLGENIEHDVAV